MRFFSGFSLCQEKEVFAPYLKESDFVVAGFSKGAIDALEFALQSDIRIDLLQLFSPAFFMDKEEFYKQSQLDYFQKNEKLYIRQFLKNIAYPSSKKMDAYYCHEDISELERLLFYNWKERDLQKLAQKGIMLEVYLGGRDKIIDPMAVKAFFQPYATVYFIKEGGHILDGQD